MKLDALRMALAIVLISAPALAGDKDAACKPVTQYGVSGCELLPGGSCPAGYHKQAVDPPNPQMKAPTRLMCVADKPTDKKKRDPFKHAPKPKTGS